MYYSEDALTPHLWFTSIFIGDKPCLSVLGIDAAQLDRFHDALQGDDVGGVA